MANKKILINATCDAEKPSGVPLFNREVTKNLIKINPDIFTAYMSIDFLPDFNNKYLNPNLKYNRKRILWEQTDLSLLEYNLIFSTVTEGPILTNNKAVVVHDMIPMKYPQYFGWFKYYVQYVIPLVLKTSKFLFFNSKSTKEETYKYFNVSDIPSKVVYHGYDTENFKLREKGFIKAKYGYEKYFLYVGEMRTYKNIDSAILAYHKSNLSDYKFLIAGRKDNNYYPSVQKLVDELKLNDKVIFLDYVPSEELPYFYTDATALVFPSEYEGFGIPPLESMASGTPVITTRCFAIPEVCGNAAVYIEPKNITDISNTMIKIANDDDLKMILKEKSLERVKLFSWEKCAKEHYDVLTSLI